MNMEQANHFTPITYDGDKNLIVYVNRNRPESPVWLEYCNDPASTPFQSADMPIIDQDAAAMINDWLEGNA